MCGSKNDDAFSRRRDENAEIVRQEIEKNEQGREEADLERHPDSVDLV